MKSTRGNVKALTKFCVISGMLSAGHVAMAQTSVQVYGLVDTYIGSIKRSDQTDATAVVNGGGTATSFWGIRGTEDLGGGLKALFVMESFFQSDTGALGRNTTDPFFSKDSFLGLSGSVGQITVGRHTLPFHNALIANNPFGGSLQFAPVMLQTWLPTYGRNVLGDSKWDNSVQYTSPTMDGFRGQVTTSTGESAGHTGTGNYGLAGSYTGGPFSATLVAQKVKVGVGLVPTTTSAQQSVLMGGATYNFNLFKLYGTYYSTQVPVADINDKTAQLGVSVPLGAGKISASWANSRTHSRGLPSVARTDIAAGYEYALSTRTALYGIYLLDKLSNDGSAGSVGVGIRHTF